MYNEEVFDSKGHAPIERDLIVCMANRLRHRGPDGEGYFLAPGVALGHRRLAIIDPTGGSQPMYNEDGSVAVIFNGCIYNFRELKAALQENGHTFKTNCDTEVIVHGWEQWGVSCVSRFRGMFAFAVWDAHSRSLFLARDRLGKKPLYYSELADGRIVFGSELKALLVDPAVSREIDPYAVDEFFAYGYIPDPRTIYRSVAKLPPAHTLLVKRGGRPLISRYWDLAFEPRARSEAVACEELIEQLHDAVSVRLVSDVPLGAFLSGGVELECRGRFDVFALKRPGQLFFGGIRGSRLRRNCSMRGKWRSAFMRDMLSIALIQPSCFHSTA